MVFASQVFAQSVFVITDIVNGEIVVFRVFPSSDPIVSGKDHFQKNIYLGPNVKENRDVVARILNREFHPTVLTTDEAAQLFQEIQKPVDPLLKIIQWEMKGGGCSHRVRQLSRWLRSRNIRHEDVYLAGTTENWLRLKSDPSLSWPYHNAIVLTVEGPQGTAQKMVIDLTLHPDGLIPLKDWVNLMEAETPAVEPLELHYAGFIRGYAQEAKILKVQPSEFDPYWDYSAFIQADRDQCIEQDKGGT